MVRIPRFLLLALAAFCGSCAAEQPRVIGEVPKPIKEVFDFKHQSSVAMCEALWESFGEKYPFVRFSPDRRARRVYLRYDDDFELPPGALQAMKQRVEELDRK